MFRDMAVFLVLFAMQLMMFSSIASIMFPDVTEFATVTKSIVYLFGAALGKNRS